MPSNNYDEKIEYIFQLPITVMHNVCEMLDYNEMWIKLAEQMNYDVLTVDKLRQKTNPTKSLLEEWGQKNHTITELFKLLAKIDHYQLMTQLKPFVKPEDHHLIDNPTNFQTIRRLADMNLDEKDLKIEPQNFNNIQLDETKDETLLSNNEKSKESEARKIFNSSPQASSVPSDSNNSSVRQSKADTPKINNIFKFLYDTILPEISYDELTEATGGWRDNNIKGKGGFGTVYEGWWNQTPVAIKKIKQPRTDPIGTYSRQLQRSARDLELLNPHSHENILSLFAYNVGPEALCLVYQFFSNGSLADRLWLKKRCEPLTWLQRHNVAKGTAKGLQYLHTVDENPLIHGNIKSANILLDQNLQPKIGDFGLAREVPEIDSMKVNNIRGSWPYVPLEYLQCKILSTKIDTYSYGIVLFELATGRPAYDNGRPGEKFLKDFIDSCGQRHLPYLKDEKAGKENEQVFENLIVLGKWCTNTLAEQRPEMVSVFEKLC